MYMIHIGRLYQSSALHSAPYSVLTHTPLSYLLDYPVYSFAPDLRSLRLVTIILTLLCAALVGVLVHFESNNRLAAAFAACLFLVCSPVFFWSQVARCTDPLACLFSLFTLLALVAMRASILRELVIGILLALAVLSKQTTLVVLTPVLVAHGLMIERSYRAVLQRLVFCAAILIPVFLYLQQVSHGGFVKNIIGGNLVRMDFAWWQMINANNVRMVGFTLFAFGVLYAGRIRKSPVFFWLLLSLTFALLATVKRGADTNYYFDTSAALAIMAATSMASLSKRRRVILTAALLPGILGMVWVDVDRTLAISATASRDYGEMIAWLRQHQTGKSPIVLSYNADVSIALGEEPVWDDPFIFTEWAQTGHWSDDAIAAEIQRGGYSAIVTSAPTVLFSHHLRFEIAKSYTLVKVFQYTLPFESCIYMPNDVIATGQARSEFPQSAGPDAHQPTCSVTLQ